MDRRGIEGLLDFGGSQLREDVLVPGVTVPGVTDRLSTFNLRGCGISEIVQVLRRSEISCPPLEPV